MYEDQVVGPKVIKECSLLANAPQAVPNQAIMSTNEPTQIYTDQVFYYFHAAANSEDHAKACCSILALEALFDLKISPPG